MSGKGREQAHHAAWRYCWWCRWEGAGRVGRSTLVEEASGPEGSKAERAKVTKRVLLADCACFRQGIC